PVHAASAGNHRAQLLPSERRTSRGALCRAVSASEAGDHRRCDLRRLAEGPTDALRRWRDVRPDLPAQITAMADMATMSTGTYAAGAAALARRRHKRPGVLPGFGLSMGYAVLYLSLLVLIPLASLPLKSAGLGWDGFWATVTAPRVVASYRLTFGAALLAALVNLVFGLLVAWVLVRYRFPGKKIVDALVDLPFALPTAVAGIALTALYAKNGWLGGPLESWLGIKVAFTPVGIVVALIFIGIPFV